MGKISIGTFHSWLKQHRPYVGICPSQSDYCDNCKEYNEEIARARQIANRLKQSGHSTEESILEQEQAMVRYTALLQQHKRLKQGWNTTGGLPLKQNQCTSTSALCSICQWDCLWSRINVQAHLHYAVYASEIGWAREAPIGVFCIHQCWLHDGRVCHTGVISTTIKNILYDEASLWCVWNRGSFLQ